LAISTLSLSHINSIQKSANTINMNT